MIEAWQAPAPQVMLALGAGLAAATAAARGRRWQSQVNGWWRLLPVVFVAGWAGVAGVWALVLVIGALALRELVQQDGLAAAERRALATTLAVALLLQALLAPRAPGMVAAGFALLGALAWGLYRLRGQRACLLAALFSVQAAGLGCLPVLAQWPGAPPLHWFLYACVVTALNDIAQFVSGKLLGRHALAPGVSPNKTWQGAIGGWLGSMAVSVAVGAALGLGSAGQLLWLGTWLAVCGLLGDLLFSAGKRALGVKDYSQLIPGHGGILDRVDSLVLTAPALCFALSV